MAKDPAFLFYSNDFISGTYTFTNEQVGKYIRLLCLQHQKKTLTEKDMLFICNSYDVDIFEKFVCENGNYYNSRLRIESEKRKKYSESRAKNRQMTENQNNTKKHMNNISKTYEKHMEDVIINENINDNLSLININISEEKNLKKVSKKFCALPESLDLCKDVDFLTGLNVANKIEDVWKFWRYHKKQNKKDFKTEYSAKIGFEKFLQISGNNLETGKEIIKRSIANNWVGLFPVDKKQTNQELSKADKTVLAGLESLKSEIRY